uniref:LMxysn_1693 family intestinal colonization protein n=1 Tax=Enterococcus faecium TaxID=1352 RepID=UPI0039AF4F5D
IIGNPSLNHRYRKGFYSLFKTLQQNPYLGIETHSRGTKLSVSANVFGMKIEIARNTSASGKFKKYRQNARITVTYRVYRKVDNKYIRTQTSTANTQYIDYIPA